MLFIVGFLLGIIVCLVAGYFLSSGYRKGVSRAQRDLVQANAQIEAQERLNQLAISQAKEVFEEKIDKVATLATQELSRQTKDLLESAQASADSAFKLRSESITQSVKPVTDLLAKLQEQIAASELQSVSMQTSIQSLTEAELGLRTQTNSLVEALRSNTSRGRWGEIQLRRVIELAGMLENCDFVEQKSTGGPGGGRPDVSVRLPGGGTIPIDAKFPFDAFDKAIEAKSDGEKLAFLEAHAKAVRGHISQLGSKEYWKDLEGPEFVVAFFSPWCLLKLDSQFLQS